MGRKEDRKLKKFKGESLKKPAFTGPKLTPFMMGNTKVIPVHVDNEKKPTGPVMSVEQPDESGGLTPEEFSTMTHELSDRELNRIIYQNARMAVDEGFMPERPTDDFGTVMWFTWNFITEDMRESFPAIAKEYLSHYRDEDPCPVPKYFENIPYPRMNESTWDDAYYFRVLLIMLYSARSGSSYSKNFLISLYKVYYKSEYNKLKRLKILTYLDILEFHDEDCYRRGLPSGHTVDGQKSYKEIQIEKRMHEPGWTDVFDNRIISPIPGKHKNGKNAEELNKAAAEIRDMSNYPDEPPIQPAAARLLIMAELLGMEIESTCNEQAVQMNEISSNMSKLTYLNSPEYRKLRNEMVERCAGMLRANYPEMFDPFKYQKDQKYLGLEVAELVLGDVFKKYDTNVRLIYDSRKFELPLLMADLTITLQLYFPDIAVSFDEVLVLSMVQYLSECLCDVLSVRDDELEEILKFKRRKGYGEWEKEETNKQQTGKLTEKVLKSVEGLREKEEPAVIPEEENLDEESLKQENERLKMLLAEKEMALAESEQKTIRQRVLYEKEKERNIELERAVDESTVEHAELIALREYVYKEGLKGQREEPDLDEQTREEIIEKIKDKKVAVLGGTERWMKRMKRLLPSWSFISVEDDSNYGINALEKADFVYIYTSVLQHSQYYRAMNIVRSNNKMLYYLGSSNADECLKQLERELCR